MNEISARGEFFKNINEYIDKIEDIESINKILGKKACNFMNVDSQLQDNYSIAMYATEQDLENFKHCSIRLRNDKNFVKNFIIEEGSLLEFVGQEIKNDKNIVLLAVENSPVALRYASDTLRNDKEVVLAHVQHIAFDYFGIGDALVEEIGKQHPKIYLENYFLNGKLQAIIPNKEDKNIKRKL